MEKSKIAILIVLFFALLILNKTDVEAANDYEFTEKQQVLYHSTSEYCVERFTSTFTYNVNTDDAETQRINTQFNLFINEYPAVKYTLIEPSSGSFHVNGVKYYFIIGGKEYEVVAPDGLVSVPGGFNTVGFKIEVDVTMESPFVWDYDNTPSFTALAITVPEFRFSIIEQATSKYGLLQTISDNLSKLLAEITSSGNKEEYEQNGNDFDSSLSEYSKTESEISDVAFENLKEYTLPSDGFASYGSQFVNAVNLVSGMMQSIYVSMGEMKILISVIFSLTLSAMMLGLFRFFKR